MKLYSVKNALLSIGLGLLLLSINHTPLYAITAASSTEGTLVERDHIALSFPQWILHRTSVCLVVWMVGSAILQTSDQRKRLISSGLVALKREEALTSFRERLNQTLTYLPRWARSNPTKQSPSSSGAVLFAPEVLYRIISLLFKLNSANHGSKQVGSWSNENLKEVIRACLAETSSPTPPVTADQVSHLQHIAKAINKLPSQSEVTQGVDSANQSHKVHESITLSAPAKRIPLTRALPRSAQGSSARPAQRVSTQESTALTYEEQMEILTILFSLIKARGSYISTSQITMIMEEILPEKATKQNVHLISYLLNSYQQSFN